jgi:hypothetical protein
VWLQYTVALSKIDTVIALRSWMKQPVLGVLKGSGHYGKGVVA